MRLWNHKFSLFDFSIYSICYKKILFSFQAPHILIYADRIIRLVPYTDQLAALIPDKIVQIFRLQIF